MILAAVRRTGMDFNDVKDLRQMITADPQYAEGKMRDRSRNLFRASRSHLHM